METLNVRTPAALIRKQGITEPNNYYQYSMNAFAPSSISSTAPTMDHIYSSKCTDNTGTQATQVTASIQHKSIRASGVARTTTKSNSHDSNYSGNGRSSPIDIRSNFRRSHTCGSLFAKCGCSAPSPFDTLVSNDNDANNPTEQEKSNKVNYANGNVKNYLNNLDKEVTKIFNATKSNQENSDKCDPPREKRSSTKSTYVHPDTAFVFTDENKNPSAGPSSHKNDRSSTITTKNGGKLQLRAHQRLSSPNIGNYAIVDVAVHPEIVLKLSADRPRNRTLKSSYSEDSSCNSNRTRRPQLQRSQCEYYDSTDFESAVCDPSSDTQPLQSEQRIEDQPDCSYQQDNISDSPYNFELPQSESSFHNDLRDQNDSDRDALDAELPGTNDLPNRDLIDRENDPIASDNSIYSKVSADQKAVDAVAASDSATPTIVTAAASAITSVSSAVSTPAPVDSAQKYFLESGILGPIVTSSVSSLIRKTSKIMQDGSVIEHIRKNSKLIRQGGMYKDELEYTRSLIPSIKLDIEKKDQQDKIKNLEDEVVHLRDIIKARDNEIYKLKREIHKLKSVLQQTTNHMSIAPDDLLSTRHHHSRSTSPIPTMKAPAQSQKQQTPSSNINASITTSCLNMKNANIIECNDNCHHPHSHHQYHLHHQSHGSHPLNNAIVLPTDTLCISTANVCNTSDIEPIITNNGNYNCQQLTHECLESNNNVEGLTCSIGSGANSTITSGAKGNHLQPPQHAVVKKQGVSGESSDPTNQQSNSVPIPKFKKDFRSKQVIKDAIMDNDFLKNIDSSQVRELVESMYSLDVAKGEYVIREGEVGAHLYVSAEGEFEVMKSGKVLGIMGPGKAFGELAILYNCTRTASIRSITNGRVWVLDRRVFQQIMMRTGMQRIEDNVNFLKSVPLLKNLTNDILAKIADVLEVEFYPAGTYIIRQGASGDTFFLISQGNVKVTQRLTPSSEEKEIRTLNRGDYFGEQALINEDKRTANIIAMAPGVECLTLDRESFTHLIGDLCELKEKNYGDESRVLAMKFEETSREVFGTNVKQELQELELNDLEVVTTLGIGGFGRVELVKCYRENRVETYALKCLKKKHILDTRQEEHVFSERTIMLSCHTPFICRLYRTFKDPKYVYMLLEACMGGEVWTILRDRGCFDENTAQFIIGCVLQAFEYLHSRGIIYRDLKPENLMLDERGYVKLVDFGFAKYIGQSSKTWTFCGTPEYVAPEIILNKGHDRAVDYWALGILIHELLNGTPPFTANDPMKTYNIILKGIDMVDFPKHMSRSAVTLIKKLCRDVPAERLGYQKGGIQDIKKHKWFQGFDWDGLASLTLIPPFLRPVSHSLDTSYFDSFSPDMEIPPDEESGWDENF